jgi:ketol-acid reductoisomerase
MTEVLAEVRAGRFADELRSEEESGYQRLEKARAEARSALVEATRRKLGGEEV